MFERLLSTDFGFGRFKNENNVFLFHYDEVLNYRFSCSFVVQVYLDEMKLHYK